MPHGGDIYRNIVNIDMSVNLNPYTIPDSIFASLESGLKASGAYPDIDQQSVRCALSTIDGLDSSCCLAANGASELIMAVTAAIAPKKAAIVCPAFSGYKRALSRLDRCEMRYICLTEENGFEFTKDVAGRIPADTDLVCIADPISHTGKNIDDTVLDKLLEYSEAHGISVALDESFFFLSERMSEYVKRDTAAYIKRYPGLYIIRSFTKILALPGIRMGYLISRPQNIERVKRQLPEWNLSIPAQYCMEECAKLLKEGGFVYDSLKLISKGRGFLKQGISDAGYTVFDSDTVYLCFKAAPGLYAYMLDHGILIRDLQNEEGFGSGYFRIAVKDDAENAEFVRLLKEYGE